MLGNHSEIEIITSKHHLTESLINVLSTLSAGWLIWMHFCNALGMKTIEGLNTKPRQQKRLLWEKRGIYREQTTIVVAEV